MGGLRLIHQRSDGRPTRATSGCPRSEPRGGRRRTKHRYWCRCARSLGSCLFVTLAPRGIAGPNLFLLKRTSAANTGCDQRKARRPLRRRQRQRNVVLHLCRVHRRLPFRQAGGKAEVAMLFPRHSIGKRVLLGYSVHPQLIRTFRRHQDLLVAHQRCGDCLQ